MPGFWTGVLAGAIIAAQATYWYMRYLMGPLRCTVQTVHPSSAAKGQLIYEAVHDVQVDRRSDFEFDGTELTIK